MTVIDRIAGTPVNLLLLHPDGTAPLYKPVHTYGSVTDEEVAAFAAQHFGLPAGQVVAYRTEAA